MFRAEKDYGALVAAALPLLKAGGTLLASTNAAGLKAGGISRGHWHRRDCGPARDHAAPLRAATTGLPGHARRAGLLENGVAEARVIAVTRRTHLSAGRKKAIPCSSRREEAH